MLNRHLRSTCPRLGSFARRAKSSSTEPFEIRGSFIEAGCVPDLGRYCELNHTFSHDDVVRYAELAGDNNPIHIDPVFAEKTIFKGTY